MLLDNRECLHPFYLEVLNFNYRFADKQLTYSQLN